MSNVRATERKISKEYKFKLPGVIHGKVVEMYNIKSFVYFPRSQYDTFTTFMKLINKIDVCMGECKYLSKSQSENCGELIELFNDVLKFSETLSHRIKLYYDEMDFINADTKKKLKARNRVNDLGISVAEFIKLVTEHKRYISKKYNNKKVS